MTRGWSVFRIYIQDKSSIVGGRVLIVLTGDWNSSGLNTPGNVTFAV